MNSLYGIPLSPFVRKVMLTLEYKRIDFTSQPLFPRDPSPEFRAISPLGKIPAFADATLAQPLLESAVICDYLECRYPQPSIYPALPEQRAQCLWLQSYADTSLMSVTASVFFEIVARRLLRKGDTDTARVAQIVAAEQPPVFDYLETQLAPAEFAVGTEVSIADFAIATQFINAKYAGIEPNPQRWPRLSSYLQRLYQLPVINARMGADQPLLIAYD
ncbi:glutathione S-transferase family protein [Ferrimonas lipolytica]|uniref:Glutathione S-transferase family protein n=1 Tax=Ferrimonas lipolytica TaxID=2724191 RepID=A0A6H1UG56_9GAMM|nr:glutathione S-transferase family protein [Ferrimonas lipolytica]QIZ78085.1 glutathione S-transferase family protein [Ferrimonas lipolytica]